MKYIKLQSLILSLLVTAKISQAAVIVNGSFEDPVVTVGSYDAYGHASTSITGWTVINQTAIVSGTASEGAITWNAQIGNAWLDLTGEHANSSYGITQTISTDIGQAYQLSFYVGSVTDGVNFFPSTVDLQIGAGARVGYHNPNAPTTNLDWQQFTVDFTATDSSTAISFYNGNTSYNHVSALDNVSITTIPEPSVAGLAILSLFAAKLIRRRQSN